MGQSRNRDTVQVNEEGKKQLIKAKAKNPHSAGKIIKYLFKPKDQVYSK